MNDEPLMAERLKIVVAGDVSDWNMPSFTVDRIPGFFRTLLLESDLFIPNLEGPIQIAEGSCDVELVPNRRFNHVALSLLEFIGKRQPQVYSSLSILDLLKLCQNTCTALANNHTKDLGGKGIEHTIASLRRNGIAHVGAGRNRLEANEPALLRIKGKDVVVLNYNYIGLRKLGIYLNIYGATRNWPGAAYLSPQAIESKIRGVRARLPQSFVLLVLHSGRALASSLDETGIDCKELERLGADCVVLHHSHRYIPAPSNKSFFLGDFVFLHPGALPEAREGAILEIDLDCARNSYESQIHRYKFKEGLPSLDRGRSEPNREA